MNTFISFVLNSQQDRYVLPGDKCQTSELATHVPAAAAATVTVCY